MTDFGLSAGILAAGPVQRVYSSHSSPWPELVFEQVEAAKELLAVVLAWIEEVGEEQAVGLGGLLALRDALRADLAAPPDPPVGGGERA